MQMTSILAQAHDHAHDHGHVHDHVHEIAGAVSPEVALFALLSVSILSGIALLGVFALSWKQETLNKTVSYLVALAAGAMLGNAFFHLVPESFEKSSSHVMGGVLILAGFLGCYLLEKWLNLRCNRSHGGCALKAPKPQHGAHNHGHDHGHDHGHEHSKPGCRSSTDGHHHFGGHGHAHRAEYIHPTGWMSLFSHSIHNFGDGVLIAIAFMTSIPMGIATTVAIVLHEIPMELGEFGVLVNAGFKRKQAILVNMVSGVVALIGTALTLWLGSEIEGLSAILTPVGAGTVVYIAACGLIPQLQKETCARKSRMQFFIVLAGLAAMLALSVFAHAH
jgi:zinc and cadmium transporter